MRIINIINIISISYTLNHQGIYQLHYSNDFMNIKITKYPFAVKNQISKSSLVNNFLNQENKLLRFTSS